MKRANHLMGPICEPDNLRLAFWKASKGKRASRDVLAFQEKLEPNLLQMREELIKGQVQVGEYHYFHIFDPKEREICASSFRERVLHHALMNVCHPVFEQKQIFDSYASRPGKGTHAALARAKNYTRRFPCYLKMDVRKFFASICHATLKQQLLRLFKEPRLIQILFQIIDSYEASPGRGLPIGNLSSQYFANHYLSGLDHWIKGTLRAPAYVRYMDDMVLWHPDFLVIKHWRTELIAKAEAELSLTIKPPQLNRSSRGLPFLGYRLFPHKTLLSPRSKRRFVQKLRALHIAFESGELGESVYQRRLLPMLDFVKQADSKAFRISLLQQNGEFA